MSSSSPLGSFDEEVDTPEEPSCKVIHKESDSIISAFCVNSVRPWALPHLPLLPLFVPFLPPLLLSLSLPLLPLLPLFVPFLPPLLLSLSLSFSLSSLSMVNAPGVLPSLSHTVQPRSDHCAGLGSAEGSDGDRGPRSLPPGQLLPALGRNPLQGALLSHEAKVGGARDSEPLQTRHLTLPPTVIKLSITSSGLQFPNLLS